MKWDSDGFHRSGGPISLAEAHRRAVSAEEHHVASPYTRHVIGETRPTRSAARAFAKHPRLSRLFDAVMVAVLALLVAAMWLGLRDIAWWVMF